MKGSIQIVSKTQEWNFNDPGITIRAAFVENAPYAATENSPIEHGDLWILFLSIIDSNHWIAYGVVDSLIDQPKISMAGLPLERLKKLSILIGDAWFKIQAGPMLASQRHRKLVDDVKVVNPDFESMSYLKLMEKRSMTDWEALAIHWGKKGMAISLN